MPPRRVLVLGMRQRKLVQGRLDVDRAKVALLFYLQLLDIRGAVKVFQMREDVSPGVREECPFARVDELQVEL